MFTDITIGQYYPTDSIIHRLDPRTKIILTFVYIFLLFTINNILGYAIAFIFLMTLIALTKIPFWYVMKGVKPLMAIILFTVIINVIMTPGTPIWQWGILKISYEGMEYAFLMSTRLIMLVIGTSLMTLTTSPIDLTEGIEYSIKWMPFVGKYAHELSMMMSIALRFIPTLMEETDRIMKAQKARGADFESGNLIQRAKALIPILVPLFISGFRRADELATAMEARCYRGGEGRTRMHVLAYKRNDRVAFVIFSILAVLLIGSRFTKIPTIVEILKGL